MRLETHIAEHGYQNQPTYLPMNHPACWEPPGIPSNAALSERFRLSPCFQRTAFFPGRDVTGRSRHWFAAMLSEIC